MFAVVASIVGSEESYSAVVHSLVSQNRQAEAEALVCSIESREDGMDAPPGPSVYDALALGHVEVQDWDAVIEMYERMKGQGVSIGPRMLEGLVFAHLHGGGKQAVVSVVDDILQNERARIQNETFQLVAEVLFEDMDLDSFDTFRQQVRSVGEQDPALRDSSLKLVRALRVAEIEAERPISRHKSEEDMETIRAHAWKDAMKYLLEFFKAVNQD